ncbi:hypothetical protein BOX15_Mlig011004g1, partial [Macrostomum lignano]
TPLAQTALGTLLTWGLTALGAGLVFLVPAGYSHARLLNASLGFAAGVMTAASFWSLLDPAIDMARGSGSYGAKGEFAWLPVAIGFGVGAAFAVGADRLLTALGVAGGDGDDLVKELTGSASGKPRSASNNLLLDSAADCNSVGVQLPELLTVNAAAALRRRGGGGASSGRDGGSVEFAEDWNAEDESRAKQFRHGGGPSWRRVLLLVLAITVHNIPEGLAVGVSFGAIGAVSNNSSSSQEDNKGHFEAARNLAIGIGIQNFPEGLAVSLPLHASGMSPLKSFWWGQLSGMVEPIAGLLGCLLVSIATPLLPYALAFAAGAMIYVVFDAIVPESTDSKLTSAGCIVGFIVMMVLDVGLS